MSPAAGTSRESGGFAGSQGDPTARNGNRPQRSRLPWAIGGAIVAIGVVVVLLVAGVIPTPRMTVPPPPPAAMSVGFASALRAANATAAGADGGPWVMWSATGVDSREVRNGSGFLPWSESEGCSPSAPFGGAGPASHVPAYSGPIDSGLAPYWLFAYANASSTSLIVVVVNGSAFDAGTVTPSPLCVTPAYGAVPAIGLFNSSAAAAAAGAVNSSFVNSFPGLNATLSLTEASGGGSSGEWQWLVEFTSCPAGAQVFGPTTPHYPGELDGQTVAAATDTVTSPNSIVAEVTCVG